MNNALKIRIKTFRASIKRYGIKAHVAALPIHAGNGLRVTTTSYDARFTSEEIRNIANIAVANDMTGVKGTIINIETEIQLTHKIQFNFYMQWLFT